LSKPNRNEIHAYIREQILLLDLPPGSRLREERLAEHFGVSRTPIRQVLDRLEFEGLVEQGEGRGARVSALDPKELRDIRALGALYNRYHEAMLTLVGNQALVRIHDLLYVQTARVWMQFLPEMDISEEIDIMAEEVGETLAALAEGTIEQVAQVRSEHMRRLLDRFNRQMTAFPAVPA
jgi:DNA-binding GntR family transcriptional regulator